MSNELQSVLDDIKLDKQTNLKPKNIKKDITVLGVTGTLKDLDTSDATATTNDIINPKTAYVNGEKIVGAISQVTEATGVPSYDDISYSNTTGRALLATCFRHNIAVTRVNNYTIRIHKVVNGVISDNNDYINVSNTTLISGSASYYIYNVDFGGVDIDSENVYVLFSWAVDKSNFRASILPLNFSEFTIGEPKSVSFGRYTDGGTWSQILVPRPNDPSTFVLAHNCNTNGRQHEMWGIYLSASGTLSKAFEYVTTWYDAPNTNFGRWSANGKYFYYTDASKTQKIYEVSSNGTVWTLLHDGYSAVPIPLLDNNAIESKNVYSYPGKIVVGTSDISITRSNTNYYVVLNFVFVLSSSVLYIYQLNSTSLTLVGSINSVSSVAIDGDILRVIDSKSVVHFIDVKNIPYLVLGLIRNDVTYMNTANSDVTADNITFGKIAYGRNGKVIGTMPDNGELNYTPSTEEQTIPAGYTSGGTISAAVFENMSEYNTCLALTQEILE